LSWCRRIQTIEGVAGLDIRRMRTGELEEVVGVWERSRWDAQSWLKERMGHTHEDNLSYFRDVIARECDVWVAVEGGVVQGLLAWSDGQVEQLYVEPSHQGAGIGTLLLDEARKLSPEGLTLFTHQRNERARAFYEGRGFRAVRFGVSPAPESEPDVKYEWTPTARTEARRR